MTEKKISDAELEELIVKIKELGLSYREGAKRFGINLWRIYNFNKTEKKAIREKRRSETRTEAAAEETPPGEPGLPDGIEELIVTYKRDHPSYGFKRIEDWLKQKHLLVVSRKQIRKVLKRRGMLAPDDSSFDRPSKSAKGSRRFEAPYARSLYQIDVTYVYIQGIPVLYLVNVVDDYSRFCVGSELCRDQGSDSLAAVLHTAITRYGKPAAVLTDQGPSFYTWSAHPTRFQQYLDDLHIEHIVTDPHSPQTIGKVERFNQTIKKELLGKRRFAGYEEAVKGIAEFITFYNYERAHQGIGGQCPADRFHGVSGERRRVEAELLSRMIDLSRGYVLCKFQDHTISIAGSSDGIRVYLDGELMAPAAERSTCKDDRR